MHLAFVRRAIVLSALGLLSLVPACAPGEHVLLLEVRSQADVDTLHIEVIPVGGTSAVPTERMERINRTRDSINNEEPIRIAVSFAAPVDVVVYVRATSRGSPPRTLLATRCYTVAGIVRDSVLLVQLDASVDVDGDGFPRQATATCRDLAPDGSTIACDVGACDDAVAADCDDDPSDDPVGASEELLNRAADIFPGATFFCDDDVDQNCRIDDPAFPDGDEPCQDRDEDGWQACSRSGGLCDCDDTNATINPDAVDECGDTLDSNCDMAPATCDNDGDGVEAAIPVGGSPDCDDTNPAISPRVPEDCATPYDDNCNVVVNEGCTDGDLDNDGADGCTPGMTDCTVCDCNDCNGAVGPSAPAICDGLDNRTGLAMADCASDTDRDGFTPPLDCNEGDPRVYQNAPEHCGDSTSENCIDPPMACTEGTDADMDGYTAGSRGQDCDDTDPGVAPFAPEACNGVDDDCDDIVNESLRTVDDGGCVFDARVCPACADDTTCGGERCIGGICGAACEVDFRAAMGSIDHCGGCSVQCNTGPNIVANLCLSGACDCESEPGIGACAANETCCLMGTDQGCADIDTDPRNCGFCGNPCSGITSPDCVGGTCTCSAEGAPCTGGLACCGTGCVDLANDDMNCGFCGHVCGPASSCRSGACTCDTADDFDCNGDLAAAANDGCESRLDQVTQCGGCGLTCMTANVTAATCGGAPGMRTCAITACAGGFQNCNPSTADGCETNLGTTSNCRACGTVCSPMNATAACEAAGCGYSSCSSGFGDCDPSRANGCETSLGTTSNCRACGTVCNPMNATAACEATGCGFSACSTDFASCDGNRPNGCETAINTASRCGACGTDCNTLPNVDMVSCGGSPGARTCTIGTCDGGFADCNAGSPGCETPLRTLSDCTGCGVGCSFPNAAESCSTGTCVMGACDSGFADCSVPMPGCETPLRTLSDCTGCGVACSFPNAAESCSTGTCVMGACDAGFLDCSAPMPGCETAISGSACGASCRNCTADPHVASATCGSGSCNYTCDAGWGDCTAAPGCETDLSTTANCGACGSVCANDAGSGTQAETCMDTGGSVYRCRCRSVTATGPGQACTGADVCCSGGAACQATMCM